MFIGIALVSFVPTHVLFFYHIFFSMDGPPNSCSPAHLNLGGEKHTVNSLLSLAIHNLAHLQHQRRPVILDPLLALFPLHDQEHHTLSLLLKPPTALHPNSQQTLGFLLH